jgi:cytochrome c-type biogenesis protein CcmH/NrfG
MIVVADSGPLHYLILLNQTELLRQPLRSLERSHADLVLIDETAGRAEARRRNLRVTVTTHTVASAGRRRRRTGCRSSGDAATAIACAIQVLGCCRVGRSACDDR